MKCERPLNVASWELEHVRRCGDRTSVVAGDSVWTSTQLFSSASRLAQALIDHHVAPGDRVAIALPNCPELFVTCSAVWMVGAVVSVLPAAADPSVVRMIRHCRPAALICTPALALEDPVRMSVRTRIEVTQGAQESPGSHCFEELLRHHPPLPQIVPRDAADIAQLCLTSGVTGEPRAAVYTHGGTAAFWKMAADITAVGSGERVAVLAFPPTAFGARFIGLRFAACVRYVLLPKFSPEAVAAAIERHSATEVSLLPTMAEQLLAYAYSRNYDCSSLRTINLSGAHVSRRLVERLKFGIGSRRVWQGIDAPGSTADSSRCSVVVHYGLTETGGGIASTAAGGDGLVGRIAPHVEIRIVDDSGADAPPGQVGEIFARSPYASLSYWEDPEATAAVFCDGYVRTGDLGSLDENGELRLEGRKKDFIIQGGYNVPAGELVATIGRLAGVAECVVVGIPNELLGEEVVACVVRKAEVRLTESEVLAHCRAELDARKLPGRTLFFEDLPRTHTGKPDLRALRDRVEAVRGSRAESPLLESLRLESRARRSVLLRDAVRSALEEVLREGGVTAPKRSGELVADALFGELGLDSLGAVRLARRLGDRLGESLSPIEIYANPSIAALSAWAEAQWLNAPEPAVPAAAAARDIAEDAGVIAIVGIGCRLPGGVNGPDEYWSLLERGVDTVREPPANRNFPERDTWKASFLDRADHFDARFFRLRSQATSLDPRHRMLLEVAWEALEDAGHDPLAVSRERTGLFLGIFGHRYGQLDALESAPGTAVSYVCQFLDIRGPVLSLDTTCSSSLVAVHNAVCSLRNRECRVAIAGGVNLIAAPSHRGTLGVTSADGRTKSFDASADGFGRGEGCVLFVLKRLTDAERDGDRVYAIVRGTAINHDGRSTSLTAPSAAAQEDVIRSALDVAGISSESVQYVEAHGSGTVLGDPIEVDGLARVFGARRAEPLEIGSVKTNVGHLEAAAGAVAMARVALSIAHRRLTKNLHFLSPNPHVPWSTVPIRVRDRTGAWPNPNAPLIAGVSAFGMSGTNAHAVLCESPAEPADRWWVADSLAATEGPWVLLVSARSPEALRANAARWATALENGCGDVTCRDIAYTASCRRAHLEHRLAIAGRTRAEWAAGLRRYCAGPADASSGFVTESGARLAVVFGDEAGRWPRESIESEPALRDMIAEWAASAEPLLAGRSFDDVAASSWPDPTSMATAVVRLVALQVSLYRRWITWGVVPHAVLGCGAGEIAAAHVAGAITREQAIRLAVTRGRILGERRVEAGARARAAHGWIGARWRAGDAVERADLLARFADALGGSVVEAALPLFSTITAGQAPPMDPLYWARQLDSPVRVRATVEALLCEGWSIFLETGFDSTLRSDLHEAVTTCSSSGPAMVVSATQPGMVARDAMVDALCKLYCSGYVVDWARLYAVPGRFVRLPTYQWEHASYWDDSDPPPVGQNFNTVVPDTRQEMHSSPTQSTGNPIVGPDAQRVGAMSTPDTASLRRYLSDRLGEFGERLALDSRSGAQTLEALGVDSLGVIRLRVRLAEDLGVRLAADALSVASTVDEVLRSMNRDRSPHTVDGATTGPATVAWLRSDGKEPTHFWVHPIGGGIDCYRELARLSPFRSAAIEIPGLTDPSRRNPASIEEMAQGYIEAIRAAGLPRTFVLGGWSLGGLIAYEMARRLRALGQGPALVVLIDTYATRADVSMATDECARPDDPKWTWTDYGLALDPEHRALERRIRSSNLSAWDRYNPAAYDGPVLSARATAAKGYPDRAWVRVAPAVEVETIDADHESIIRSPALGRVLAAINARIDSASLSSAEEMRTVR